MNTFLKQAEELLDKIYNLSSILKQYCRINKDIEEISHICTLVEYLCNEIDNLYCIFLNFDDKEI
jgi:hypothetical protein